jgi:hypothetical protein
MTMLRLFVSVASIALIGCSDDAATTGSPASTGTGASTSTSTGGGGGTGGQGGAGPDTVSLTTYLGSEKQDILFVAAQDGDAAWQPLTGTNGTYSFDTSGRFGIAYVCVEPGSTGLTIVSVLQATTADFTSLVRVCPAAPPSNTTPVTGTVTGIAFTDTASITMGPYAGAGGVTAAYQMAVPQGTWDIAAIHDIGGPQGQTDHIIVRRDIAVAATAVTQNFNFLTEGVATALRTMNIEGASGTDTVVINSFLRLEDGGSLMLAAQNPSFAVVPASELSGNDTHFINCFVSNPAVGLRGANTFAKDPQDIFFTLMEPLVANVTVSSTTPLQFEATFAANTEAYNYGLAIGQNTTGRRLFVTVSTEWLGPGAMLTYTTPDLTALAGWDPSWELSLGELTAWFASTNNSSESYEYDDKPTPGPDPTLEGVVRRSATFGGEVTP